MVIRLDDDDQDAVDMMLEHLYTLEKPTLLTAKAKDPNIAEKAYIIGDKYDLPSLRSVGKSSLEAMTRVQFQSWDAKNEASKQKTIVWIQRIWSWKQDGLKYMRELCVDRLAGMSESILDFEPFQKLMWENKEFGMQFIEAMRKQVYRNHRF